MLGRWALMSTNSAHYVGYDTPTCLSTVIFGLEDSLHLSYHFLQANSPRLLVMIKVRLDLDNSLLLRILLAILGWLVQ